MKLIRIFLLLLLPLLAFGQKGSISGQILDKQTQETLIGATVMIDSSSIGTATDIDGNYVLSDLDVGVYNVRISYIGYTDKLIGNVVVKAGETTVLNVVMDMENGLLDEIVITDFAITNSETAMTLELKKSNMIANGISAQQISKTLDRDAAQVVKRIPGVTLMGNFINIRGLNPRYNNVMFQNAIAPSLETDVKSFSFDMIPSGQLDRIIVIKSPTADVTGDFAGGLVKIYTKSIPDSNFTSLGYTTTMRTGTVFQDFYQQQHGKGFWAGFDKYHQLPSDFPQDVRDINSASELVDAGQSLNNDWVSKQKTAIPDQRFAFVKGTRIRTDNALIGNITALNYSYTSSRFNVARSDFNVFDKEKNTPSPIYDFQDMQYNVQTRTNILHNWSFKFKGKHLIELKNLANFSASGQYVHRTGQDYEFNYYPENHSFDQTFKGLYVGQVSGTHKLLKESASIDWLAGYSHTYRNQPDYKRYRSELDPQTGKTTLYVPIGSAQANFLGRFFSEMKEDNYTASVNFSYKIGYLKGNKIIPTISTGTYNEYKNRKFDARNLGFVRANIGSFDNSLLENGIDNLFQPENINTTTGIIIDEQTNPSDAYIATNLLNAWYVNSEIPINKWKIIAGVRLEYNQQKLSSADLTNRPVEVNNPIFNVLPSVNVSYNITPEVLLRAAYGMNLNRPEFREIAPFGFYDFNYNFTYKGNPELNSSTIQNADLKLEWYPKNGDVYNIGGFYKYFLNPIEVVAVPGGGSGGAKNFSFANAEFAHLYGVEAEIRKNFTEATSPFLQNMGITLNGSYIHSKVSLGEAAIGQSDKRPLQGQAPYLVNVGLFYNDKDLGYQVNVVYNITGKRILFVGFDEYPDIYEMPRHALDISGSYLFKKGVEISAGVADIVNQKVQLLQDGNGDGTLSRENDQQIQSYRPGRVFSLGVKYTF